MTDAQKREIKHRTALLTTLNKALAQVYELRWLEPEDKKRVKQMRESVESTWKLAVSTVEVIS